jgi:sugar/nucleoside kinase (ribokinase family)
MKICLDLASYNVVEDHKAFFLALIRDFVDILFANDQEAEAITGRQPDEAIQQLGKLADIVVIKLGAEGSIVHAHGKKTRIGVKPSEPVDTTGAGDLYAAGFIYGHIRGQSVAVCGKIGSILAGRVIEIEGAKMDESTWERLRREIHQLMEYPG